MIKIISPITLMIFLGAVITLCGLIVGIATGDILTVICAITVMPIIILLIKYYITPKLKKVNKK